MTGSAEREWIEEAERRLGVRFPPAYVSLMRKSNGGEVRLGDQTWSLAAFRDPGDPRPSARAGDDVVLATESARERKTFPAGGVCIGHDGRGALLVLLPSYEDRRRLGSAVYRLGLAEEGVERICDHVLWLRAEPERDGAGG